MINNTSIPATRYVAENITVFVSVVDICFSNKATTNPMIPKTTKISGTTIKETSDKSHVTIHIHSQALPIPGTE